MVNQQLFDYIKQQLQQGKSKEEIKSELLVAGWQESDINQALNVPNPSQSSSLPLPPKPSSSTSTGMQQLGPKAVWSFFFRFVLFLLLPFMFGWLQFIYSSITIPGEPSAGASRFSGILVVGLTFLLIAMVFSFVWAKLTYHFYRYELTDAGFRKELGVIFKKYVTIPYDRIQNVDIYRGILARMLGLSDLKIQTAGASATV